MFASLNSIGVFGIDSYMIKIEADVSGGLPSFDIVGLPDTAVKESRDRVRAAIKNCGFKFPTGRITVNLAPADKRKEGAVYDLPILLSILAASKQIKLPEKDCAFIGELSLDGQVRPINGLLAMAITAMESGIKKLFVPIDNACEGAVIEDIEVYGIENVKSLIAHLSGENPLEKSLCRSAVQPYRSCINADAVCVTGCGNELNRLSGCRIYRFRMDWACGWSRFTDRLCDCDDRKMQKRKNVERNKCLNGHPRQTEMMRSDGDIFSWTNRLFAHGAQG